MKIKKENKKWMTAQQNSFGQTVIGEDEDVFTTVSGTLEELLDYSKDHDVAIRRNEASADLFENGDSKYVVLSMGKVISYADKRSEISGYGYYVHIGEIDQAAYNDKYQKDNIKRVVVKVNSKTQPDIIEHLQGIDNVNGYIIDLIRKDMEK